jgi:starvation-inducible DNA-binding protein
MPTTRHDLPAATRTAMVTLLNRQLASATALSLWAKQAHWNVKGPHFRPLHELFDDVYTGASEWVDLLAERAVQLGGIAEGTLARVTERSDIPGWPEDESRGRALVDGVATALGTFGAGVRKAIDTAAQAGDAGTSDLFTEISRASDKLAWMVQAHAGE